MSTKGQLECARAMLRAGADAGRLDECVRALHEATVDTALASPDDWTALMLASRRGELERVRALLAARADVAQAAGSRGLTALMLANREGHLECARALLAARADVAQASANGSTALMLATQEGRLECARALLEAGADVGQAKADGSTALMLAAQDEGQPDCLRALLEAGADVAQADEDGATALLFAAREGHLECLRALLDARADVAQATRPDGLTALMLATHEGHPECVRALLAAGADVEQAAANGSTALISAMIEDDDHPQVACARALLEAGADVPHGALELACESLELLQLLCAYAPALHAQRVPRYRVSRECERWLAATRRWTSPLHHFEMLPLERVRALLLEGADVRACDGEADAPTPLSLATARLLRGGGADDGRAALIWAAAAPWSPERHALFPAAAKARAVELLRVGWLLARRLQSLVAAHDPRQVEGAFRDAWLDHVMPRAVARSLV